MTFARRKELSNKMDEIIMRGHHLLCTRLFMGSGYSEEFAERMGEVVSRVGLLHYKNVDTFPKVKQIKVISDFDYVCQKCPNLCDSNNNNVCRLGNDDVKEKDRLTLEYAGLTNGNSYSLEEIACAVDNITEKQFLNICGECRWCKGGYCTYELLRGNMEKSYEG